MSFKPKEAVDTVRDIAVNAIERSADIVESAAQIIKGDVSAGVEGIVASSMDIATHSVGRVKEMVSGGDDEAEAEPDAAV